MTQSELQDLITNSLGAIVDEAIRTAGPHAAVTTFPASAAQIASWPHQQRLRYFIDLARHNGDLPAAPTPSAGGLGYRGDTDWPDSDWATIVGA
jgi:hypothetical protein